MSFAYALPVSVPGPIVIGGLGGSGTRAIARGIAALGVHLGHELNEPLDNLLFTLLCKRPEWLRPRLTNERPDADIVAALDVLAALMTGQPLDRVRRGVLAEAVADHATKGHAIGPDGLVPPTIPDPEPFRLAARALASSPPRAPGWGWKEPNSHVVLPELIARFHGLVYVHVLRHPLDMAFSDNLNQMRLWGPSVGLMPEHGALADANNQLRWWLRSTELAFARAESLEDRFVPVRFEEYCSEPTRTLAVIADAARLEIDPALLDTASEVVATPATIGRWRRAPWQSLDPGLRRAAGEYGFDVEG
jgi:hypothetical protein